MTGTSILTLNSFCDRPEITEDALVKEIDEVGITDGQGPFWQQYCCIFGFLKLVYGAQVTVASFTINFLVDQGVGVDQSKSSQLQYFWLEKFSTYYRDKALTFYLENSMLLTDLLVVLIPPH
ncbi:hypothetical protein EDD22DRAFT_998782 [Suillus occidentalis]|nr:hypothetical protein EDD22DRAFT_998782 [Suillus occidentalis]